MVAGGAGERVLRLEEGVDNVCQAVGSGDIYSAVCGFDAWPWWSRRTGICGADGESCSAFYTCAGTCGPGAGLGKMGPQPLEDP